MILQIIPSCRVRDKIHVTILKLLLQQLIKLYLALFLIASYKQGLIFVVIGFLGPGYYVGFYSIKCIYVIFEYPNTSSKYYQVLVKD